MDTKPPWHVPYPEILLGKNRVFADNFDAVPGCHDPFTGRPGFMLKLFNAAFNWASDNHVAPYSESLPDTAHLVISISQTTCPLEADAQIYTDAALATFRLRKPEAIQ